MRYLNMISFNRPISLNEAENQIDRIGDANLIILTGQSPRNGLYADEAEDYKSNLGFYEISK